MRDYRISGHHLTAACGLRQRAFQGACKLPTSSEMLRHFGHLLITAIKPKRFVVAAVHAILRVQL